MTRLSSDRVASTASLACHRRECSGHMLVYLHRLIRVLKFPSLSLALSYAAAIHAFLVSCCKCSNLRLHIVSLHILEVWREHLDLDLDFGTVHYI